MYLTKNYICYVNKDGIFFTVLNTSTNIPDSGYLLSDRAYFEDEGVKYSVSILKGEQKDSYKVDLKKEEK